MTRARGIQTHVLKYDGYHTSADRLLEGVIFNVTITEKDGDLTIESIQCSPEQAGYAATINLPPFVEEIRVNVQENIDYLRMEAEGENKTLSDLLDEFEQETPPPGYKWDRIDLLSEV